MYQTYRGEHGCLYNNLHELAVVSTTLLSSDLLSKVYNIVLAMMIIILHSTYCIPQAPNIKKMSNLHM